METKIPKKTKNKVKPKPVKEPVKKTKKEPKKEPIKKESIKKEHKPVKNELVKKKITVEYTSKENDDLDESKYSEKLKKLLFKIKEQHTDTDNRIRFCWN